MVPNRTLKKSKVKPLLLLALLTSIALFIVIGKYKKNNSEQFFYGSKNLFSQEKNNKNLLNTQINQEISTFQGNWSIAIKDLKTDYAYLYNENEPISSASLYKLALMWAVFDAIKKNQLAKTDLLSNSLTVESTLEKMITISDNDSAILFAEKIGWVNITELMQKEGLTGFNLSTENPTATAKSTLDLLERIYRQTAINSTYSQEMKTLLFAQQINDRIPKYLPTDVKIGHKTGEIENFRHDAGIVLGKKSHYIFVFLSETSNPQEASESIAKLSKKIFDLLEQQ